MGLLEKIKQNREEYKLNTEARKAKNAVAKAKAQAAYDIEYERGAVAAVKSRARRDAMNRFGYSKSERRGRAMQNLTKELGSLGDWGVGNKQSPGRSHAKARSHTKSRKKTGIRRQQREDDPFDMSDLDSLFW